MATPRTGLVLLAASAALIAGCGSTQASSTQRSAVRHTAVTGEAAEVAVIREWATALQRGDVRGAASYFAHPSIFANGDGSNGQLDAVVIHTERQAQVVNESLSCGARVTSTRREGKYIRANFELTNRSGPGADCGSGTGQSAATDFMIAHGRIVEWIRAPAGSATPTVPAPSANPQTPAQQI